MQVIIEVTHFRMFLSPVVYDALSKYWAKSNNEMMAGRSLLMMFQTVSGVAGLTNRLIRSTL
jgi:hypothetical protein